MVAQTQNRQQRQESNRSSMESVESVYKGGCSCNIISRDQFGSSNNLFFEIHRYLKHGGHDQHFLWWISEFFYWIPGSLQCWAWLICRGTSSCHLVICIRHCTDLCYVSGFHYLLPVSHAGGALWLYHEFYRVLALLEKQKGWKLEKEVLGL